jgi:hypothetical protein
MKQSELIHCRKCGGESELYYLNDEIVSHRYCKCGNPDLKPIDPEMIRALWSDIKKKYHERMRSKHGINFKGFKS